MNRDSFRRAMTRMAEEGGTASLDIVTRRVAWRFAAEALSGMLARLRQRAFSSLAHRMMRRRLLGR
ncbi:hypothetical protein [Roseomonas sp. AR75]|jgi:hypothetical protein|uniref:hypothetical protein n=1 Tax=Roseomonas sp. AR75 TaxID=2562311 RepID=UPI0010C0276C|nr:hypothetical protein [Roseomonas sp. AR75]